MGRFTQTVLLAVVAGLVCSAQIIPTSSSEAAARVITLTGQVSTLKDGQPWVLHVGSLVNLKQEVITGPDGYAEFQVADGSRFEVFPNSHFTFRSNPGNWKDLLDVWLGRVRVHIQKLGGKPNPNTIRTPTAVISVRGTTFDVAVEEVDTTLVSVEEGQVLVQHALRPVGDPKVLNAGEYIRVYKNQPLAQKIVDKGSVLRQAMGATAEALYRVIYNNPRVPGGGRVPGGVPSGGPGPGQSGDTETTPPPPPPPPPPAP